MAYSRTRVWNIQDEFGLLAQCQKIQKCPHPSQKQNKIKHNDQIMPKGHKGQLIEIPMAESGTILATISIMRYCIILHYITILL